MRFLALIPARGGSKRLPGKNLRPLEGKPLIVWSIEVATEVPGIVDVLVSTDDEAIAEVARRAGSLVPWLRPAELATDSASSVDVALHALDWYESEHGAVDGLLLLQPTSPLRTRTTVTRGLEAYREGGFSAMVGISRAAPHPAHCFEIVDGNLRPYAGAEMLQLGAAELPAVYCVNGAFYLVSPEVLREHRSFFPPGSRPLEISDPAERIDIDTEWDWQMAEAALRWRQSGRSSR